MNMGRSHYYFGRIQGLFNYLVPEKNSFLYRYYEKKTRFTELTAPKVIKIKFLFFVAAMLVCVLIQLTNIEIYTGEIYQKFDYDCDLIYQKQLRGSIEEAMEQEMEYFRQALKTLTPYEISTLGKDQLQERIKGFITLEDKVLVQSRETLANKIYYRITDYYKYRNWNLLWFVFIGVLVSLIPDLYLLLRNLFIKGARRKELKFLKKLIILNGSIKPVDFMELLKILMEKAKFHKKLLCEIEEKNKRNPINKRSIYQHLIREEKDIDLKLFYEKLDQANNYDFDQAILNIENEFKMEKRAELRKVRKQIEVINAAGIIGFMVLIVILILYLIFPWIKAYNMNQIL